jgi:hypothetical protein
MSQTRCFRFSRSAVLDCSTNRFLRSAFAIARVVAFGAAAVILEELLVRVVDAATGVVEADLVVLAGELGEPAGGLDRVELAVDTDLFQLVDRDDRRIAIARDVARGDPDRQPLVGLLAEPRRDRAGLGAVLGDVGAVAGNGRQNLGRHAPHPADGGSIAPPVSPCPSARMSIKLLRSSANANARRRSGLSKGGASRLTGRLVWRWKAPVRRPPAATSS